MNMEDHEDDQISQEVANEMVNNLVDKVKLFMPKHEFNLIKVGLALAGYTRLKEIGATWPEFDKQYKQLLAAFAKCQDEHFQVAMLEMAKKNSTTEDTEYTEEKHG